MPYIDQRVSASCRLITHPAPGTVLLALVPFIGHVPAVLFRPWIRVSLASVSLVKILNKTQSAYRGHVSLVRKVTPAVIDATEITRRSDKAVCSYTVYYTQYCTERKKNAEPRERRTMATR
jgi:hypothetical protein